MEKRNIVNKAASSYLCDDDEGDLYDAYLKLVEANQENYGDCLAADYVTVWQPLEHMTVDQILELIDAGISNIENGNEQESNVPEFIKNIDWGALREQKTMLFALISSKQLGTIINDNLEGIISLIDALQDYAVDTLGLDEKFIFDLDVEDKIDGMSSNNEE